MTFKVQVKYKKKAARDYTQGGSLNRRAKGDKTKTNKERTTRKPRKMQKCSYTFSPVSSIVKTESKRQFRTAAILSNSETVKSFLFSFVVKYWREIPISAARRVMVKPRRRIKSRIFSDIVKVTSPFCHSFVIVNNILSQVNTETANGSHETTTIY